MKNQKIGVIAGRGKIPELLKSHLDSKKIQSFFLGLKGFANPKICDKMLFVGQIKQAIKDLKKEKITHLIFIGGLDRPSLDDIKLDFEGWIFVLKNAFKIKGDNSLLIALANLFEKKGFEVIGVHKIMKNLLVSKKNYTKKKPYAQDKKTIKYGYDLAKKLGEMDVGQSVVVQGNLCLGLEGIEGTSALISRCAKLKRGKNKPILVKVCKPNQDKRLDMPTIGIETIHLAIKNEYGGIAIEAGAVLFPEIKEAIKLADSAGIFVVGI